MSASSFACGLKQTQFGCFAIHLFSAADSEWMCLGATALPESWFHFTELVR